MINSKQNISLFITSINFFVIGFYIIFFDLPSGSKLYHLLIFLLLLSLLSFLQIKFDNFIFRFFSSLQLSILSIIIIFFFLELIYFLKPNIFPQDLKIWINRETKNKEVVEYLDYSPYIKFKPNVEVRIQFFRGNTNQFEYTWLTDSKGFKNSQYLSRLEKVDIVTLGDSFAEGMGVSTKETFSSLLNDQGYTTYNLGVQGYSPSQMLGVFKEFGQNLSPKFVLTQYTFATYEREKFFKDKKNIRYTGGISYINSSQTNPEIREQAKYLFSALWLMTKNLRMSIKNTIKYYSVKMSDKKFNKYKDIYEIEKINSTPLDIESWNASLGAFNKINKISNTINAKMILIYIPTRPMIYYERATGKKLPKEILNESKILKDFAKKNNIIFINPTKKLIDYVNSLPLNFKKHQLPYLEIDAHMNKIGYEIISGEIKSFIEKNSNL